MERGGEVLEGGLRLGLLLTAQVDAALLEELLGPGSHLERGVRRCLGGQLQDPGPVGVEPELGDQPAVVAAR
jgi:hypothetical protein